jgi:DNA-binding PadR family transcriptional regulator
VSRSRLSTAGFAILGLLALRPFSAYELAQQIHRGPRYMLPASERNLYAEPKRLAAAGLVRMRREQVGRRSRTIYEITPAGREALRRQLATPPAPPQLEFEALQRLIFADQGSKQDLLAALDTTSRQVQQILDDGLQQVRGYQADGGPFPERLHLIMLFSRFYTDFLLLLRDWVALARPHRRHPADAGGPAPARRSADPGAGAGCHRAGRHPGPAQRACRGGRQGWTG